MSLKHILLGLLRTPASGYDLKRAFDGSAAYFWHAELSQIYPTLKRLEEDGLLESRPEPSDRGPDRQVYRITTEGRRVLEEWLREGPAIGRERLEYVAQMFFLAELGEASATRTFLERLRTATLARKATYDEIEGRLREQVPEPERMDDETFHQCATLWLGEEVLDARLAWCDRMLDLLTKRETRTESDEESS